MTRRKKDLLYRREIDGRVLELTQLDGVYELTLHVQPLQTDGSRETTIAIALVDPTFHRSK